MCGIIVVIGKNSHKQIKESLVKLSHRGKDSQQVITHNNISFGFTRLAINDVSNTAEQPFEFEEYIGLFNAEIYNHKQLKKEYHLNCNSDSDTEVILPLYNQVKENILSLLDGFYTSVIYNKTTNKIVILKDYIGKKPLFFAYDKEYQYITSELKALPQIEYFEIIPKGLSILQDNKMLLIKKHQKKSLIRPSNHQIKKIIENAVFKRIIDIKDKKIGIFLSGGLDSSIVAFLASELFPNTHINYYSILDKQHPDYKYIKIMQSSLQQTKSSFKMIKLPNREEFIDILKKVIYYTESFNPSIISNGIGSYILSKEAQKDGLKVVLTGDGADEMFMGYDNQQSIENHNEWKDKHNAFIQNLHITELRRVDLTSMANTIEIRCPFLDKEIYDFVETLNYEDLFGNKKYRLNKNILRKIFNEIPKEISNRQKVSFDVGSGIQKIMVEICKEKNITEEEYLKNIWNSFFKNILSTVKEDDYFYSYPAFNHVIPLRGNKYENA
jgi:asparagine synthase (glutamine-hydrolysing)